MDDVISRRQAIDAVNCVMIMKGIRSGKSVAAEAIESVKSIIADNIRQLPSAQSYTINPDGRLWITVDDIDKVTAVVVDEYKSKFCKQFYEDYEDAQPEPCEDAVSRKTILKFLDDWMSALEDNVHNQSASDLKIIKKDFENLPSAEPQIIRCKDCKHHWTYKCMDSMPIERCDLEQTFYDAEIDYCSLAERREDG